MPTQEEEQKPTRCPHGVHLSFHCNDCMNPFAEDLEVFERIQSKFRFKDEI